MPQDRRELLPQTLQILEKPKKTSRFSKVFAIWGFASKISKNCREASKNARKLAILGPSWRQVAQLSATLAPIWRILVPSWPQLGPSWRQLGSNLARNFASPRALEPSWARKPPKGGQELNFKGFWTMFNAFLQDFGSCKHRSWIRFFAGFEA